MYYEAIDLWNSPPNLYLEHHGVKGMKWGVRRFRDRILARKREKRAELARKLAVHDVAAKREDKITRKIFSDREIKSQMQNARRIASELNKSRDTYLSYKSDNYKNAYSKYKKDHPDLGKEDSEYGFDHYVWRSGNADYDAAKRQFNTTNIALKKEYVNSIKNITHSITGKYGSQEVFSNWTVNNQIAYEADSLINEHNDSIIMDYKDYKKYT